MTARLAVLLCIGLTAVVSASRPPQLSPATGVVVESVGPPWSGSGKAGLRQGDVITAWGLPATEPAGTHAVASLTDWFEVEAEHGPRAPGVVVSFVRDERAQTATLAGGAWMLGVGPLLDREWRADHETALTHAARGEQVQAAAVWRDLAARAMQAVDPSLPAWFWLRAGGAETAARNAAGAVTAYGAARAAARERGQLFLEREALDGLGRAQQASQQPVAAEAAWSEAVALLQSERPNSPALVRALNALGAAQREFGRLDESERIYRRALERARVVAPGSIVEVASLGGLSVTLRRRGDRAGAERTLDEAAAILEQFPDHPDRIANAGNRGILLVEQNRLAEGQQQLERAEALDRARGTPADALALAHHANLGVVAAQRGDFAQAEAYFRSFLGAAERTSMNPLERVRGLNNLAIISLERGDGERALTSFEAAQALAAKAAPGSPTLADALGNLGSARARTGDLAGSDTAYEAALRIREAVSPDEPAIAAILWSLAANAERRGDLDGASRYAARAVAHIDRTAPGGLSAARAYHVAARVALARGDLAEARRSQERGLAIARDLAPGSRLEVSALATLARVDVRERRLEAAVTRYAEAVAALAIQVRRLGAPLDLEAGYVDDADVQRPYVDALLALGRHEQALEVVERFRARSVLDRLASRDLALGRTGEAEALAREQRRLAREYDDTLAQLARLAPATSADKARALQARLRDIRDRQAATSSNLRRVDGVLGDQLDPPPPSVEVLRSTLAPGTLALVYHLGAETAVAFAISREGFRVHTLPLSAGGLATGVERWRRLIDRARTIVDDPAELDAVSATLFDALLGPVRDDVHNADRVVIVPDGPLHGLSFAALRGSAVPGGPAQYVLEWKPTSVVPSISTLAQLSARPRPSTARRTAAAFGDITITDDADTRTVASTTDRAVRQAVVNALAPLPGSRREAERVAARLAPRSSLRLGPAATESAVKSIPRDTTILHIASHGLVNVVNPLDSALVLSPPVGQGSSDNGLLQAWEIFDEVRVDADLVVLSACDTGLGRTFTGEGLLGLTRAFQFAGARAVAASLWKAPDEATATLMDAFYAELVAGSPADGALARAQRVLLSQPETRHPYFWAAFIIDGDAR